MKKGNLIFLGFMLICLLAGCNAKDGSGDLSVENSQTPDVEVKSELDFVHSTPVMETSQLTIADTEEVIDSPQGTNVKEEQTKISIRIGDLTLSGELDDSVLAKEFISVLPQTISMQRVGGGREFYGGIDGNLNYDEADAQTTFENGDIAYWFSGNGFCLLYDNQVEKPEVESGIIVIGKIISDFSELHNLDDNITAIITLAN